MLDGYKDMGMVVATGKLEQGHVYPNMKAVLMPTNTPVTIKKVFIEEDEYSQANVGEVVNLQVSGVSELDLSKGYVICDAKKPGYCVEKFEATMQVLQLPDERPVMSVGYTCMCHIHTALEECTIVKLIKTVDPKKKKTEEKPKFARVGQVLTCIIELKRTACIEKFDDTPSMGRFTLRDEAMTICIGKVNKLAIKKSK